MAEVEPDREAPSGELATGPASKSLFALQETVYAEYGANGVTPTLEKPHPLLALLWVRVHALVRHNETPEARELKEKWAQANLSWKDPGPRDWKLRSAEALYRIELLDNYLYDAGWTDLRTREPDIPLPYLTKAELEVSR